jgi:hypothetical protein
MKHKKFCAILTGGILAALVLPATADTTVTVGNGANATAPIVSSVTFNVDGVGATALSSSTLDSLSVPIYAATPGTASAGFSSFFTIQLQAARPINTTDGTTGAALTGTTTLNSLGMGVTGTGGGANQDGNFLGSGSGIFEGLLLSLDTTGLGSGFEVQLKGFTINLSAANVAMSAGLISAATDTSENFSAAAAIGVQLHSLSLATPLTLVGGNGLTHLGTFWQPTEANSGWRLDSLTFDVVAVPEPSSFALVGLGLAALVGLGRRR